MEQVLIGVHVGLRAFLFDHDPRSTGWVLANQLHRIRHDVQEVDPGNIPRTYPREIEKLAEYP